MRLKDKKIEICEYTYTSDKYGNRLKTLAPIATVWAYFRQLSMKELYSVTTQVQEEVLFQINYRTDITTAHVIKYNGIQYEITRIDTFEGYKSDLTIYCKRKSK